MRFLKVEGAGNDYVLVDLRAERVHDPAALARRVSDRRTGVGSDGLLLVGPGADGTHGSMRIFNADGSEGRMCGNGLRCVVRYLVEQGRGSGSTARVATASGQRQGRVTGPGRVTVDMGQPDFRPASLPVQAEPGEEGLASLPLPESLRADPDRAFCVSVGNPHLVVRVPSVQALDLQRAGPALATSPRLPEGANVQFVMVDPEGCIEARPFERGSGATRACGTGAVAAMAVARRLGWVRGDPVRVIMPGGELVVSWDGEGSASLDGPARFVFEGLWRGS